MRSATSQLKCDQNETSPRRHMPAGDKLSLVTIANDIDEITLEPFQTLTYTKVYSETSFSKNSYHIETSQLICIANQLTSFFMIPVFTEKHFRSDLKLRKKQWFYLLNNKISEKEITF